MLTNWGIRDRMLLLALMPPALIAMIVGFYLVNTRIQDLADAQTARGQALADQLAPAAEIALQSGRPELLRQLVSQVIDGGDIKSIRILDGAGRELVGARGPASEERPGDWLGRRLDQWLRRPPRFTTPLYVPGHGFAGQVEVELSRSRTRARQLEVLFNGLLITAVGLFLSYLLGMAVSRDVIIPIMRLTHAVRSFRRGELTRRVPETSGGELGTLERGINAMAESLQASRQELQGQVYQSNAELRTTLEELEVKNVELDLARQRAEQASRVKSQFLANMSHEIRTPVNGMIGFTQLLAQTRVDSEQDEYLQILQRSSEHLLHILNDILDFSRLEAGKLQIDVAPFDVRAVVEETLMLLAPLAFEKKLELTSLIYADVPARLAGDGGRLRQVLVNLVGNAVKFTPAGEVVVRVMVEETQAEGVLLRMTVSDTGVGIEPAEQQRIFEAFTQADARVTRRFGGTGLGLFICDRLVQAMGGRIGFESTAGKGSTFWFQVPLQAQPAAEPDRPLAGRRIVFFDANRLVALAQQHRLGSLGATVARLDDLTAFSREAPLLARDFDLAMIGIHADAATEPALTEALTALSAAGLPSAVLVNSLDRALHRRLERAGASVVLAKTQYRDMLAARLVQLLAGPPAALPTPTAAPDRTLAGLRCLVADDNPTNLRLLALLLRRRGAEVIETADGAAAVAAFECARFDVVLLDVHMPQMSGIEAMQRMRRREAEAGQGHTPMLAVTANVVPAEWARFRDAGMDDCLVKPIDEPALLEALRRRVPTLEAGTASTPAEPGSASAAPLADPELRAMLAQELPAQLAALQAAAAAADRQALAEAAHRLAGTGAWFRLPGLRQPACALEAEARRGAAMAALAAPLATLIQALTQLHTELTATPEAAATRRQGG
ncbi:MAG: ATP-binding protein [Pseudomonadota bacterium]|nr:ATP-binding protein [Pseudomonadota bacterium]